MKTVSPSVSHHANLGKVFVTVVRFSIAVDMTVGIVAIVTISPCAAATFGSTVAGKTPSDACAAEGI
jgi:hypothetical protein